mgnify:CR=1 FL=1
MKKFTAKDVTVLDGVISYTQTQSVEIDSPMEMDVAQFEIDYADKVEDFDFYESEINRIQAIIDDPATTNGAKKILRVQKKSARALRNSCDMQIRGVFEPIDAVVNP